MIDIDKRNECSTLQTWYTFACYRSTALSCVTQKISQQAMSKIFTSILNLIFTPFAPFKTSPPPPKKACISHQHHDRYWQTKRMFNTSDVIYICMLQKHCSELRNTKDISTSHVKIFTFILNLIFLLRYSTKFLTVGFLTSDHHKEETYPKLRLRNVC